LSGPKATQDSKAQTSSSTSADEDFARRTKELALYARAERLGLCGPLGKRKADVWEGKMDKGGKGEGAALVDELRAGIRRRVMRGADLGRVSTALAWFADFRADTTRVPFQPLEHAGDISASVYNAETLELLTEYMRLRGSRRAGQAGEAISADHIQTTVSTVRLLRSAEAHYGIIAASADTALTALYKDMRKDDGPKGERKECRAFRAAHFKILVGAGYDRHSTQGRREWCIALVAHNLLLRGGEVGRTTTKTFDTARDLTLTSVVLRQPCAESNGKPWLIVWVVSIKDPHMRFRAVPLPIRYRGGELCAYTALEQHIRKRWSQVPTCTAACKWCKPREGAARPGGTPPHTCARANTPLFQLEDGSAYRTADVGIIGERMATAAGLPPKSTGGKLFRIGGATDVRDVLGLYGDAAERTLKDRGRWGSDVAFIYARANMRDQLRVSAAVGDADAREMEEMVPGWVQPATFR
jgi:hypothetical protein